MNVAFAAVFIGGLLGGCGEKKGTNPVSWAPESDGERIDHMVAVEERILELTPQLGKLAESVLDLAFPTEALRRELLAPEFDLSGSELVKTVESGPGPVDGWRWTPGGESSKDPWRAVFAEIAWFENAKFYFVEGAFRSADLNEFDCKVGFEGHAKDEDGRSLSLRAKQQLTWCKDGKLWKICAWKQDDIVVRRASEPLFDEILEKALPDTETLRKARHSQHERNLIDLFTTGKYTVTKQIHADYLDLDSTFQHPGLSVVDIDRDGWDDLYVMGRWGRNQMLRNNRDGTFSDIAPDIGLDIDGFCNCAIFADFDNDGDADAFVGRSLERSLYLVNEDGRFVDRTRDVFGATLLPYLVSTISAVDYDQDGLLDVYLGLYGPPQTSKGGVEKWANRFFPKAMAAEILKRFPESHRYVNRLGPPNLLLRNRGNGRFSIASEAGDLAEWHDTYQSVWCDFDDDGDPDVYVCNDFAADHLYRNEDPEKPGGRRRFVDVSREFAGNGMQGFGMGASWGDYDRDGKLDLYVSNMFSKAGRRITGAVDGLDPRVPYSAQGNLLFRNAGTKFEQLAGVEKDTLNVAKVGWAYGAQFLDIDNDGWLDIYSASGFYTAPKAIANDKDL